MYQKNEGKFLKHLDFLILDLIIVETTYIVSYFIRHGFRCGGMSSAYWQMGWYYGINSNYSGCFSREL